MGFKILNQGDLVVSTDSVSSPMWSNNVPTLTEFFTSSVQVSSNTAEFYYDIYQTSSLDSTSDVQFSIAYADSKGSGSLFYNSLVTGSTPSKSNYGQYRTLVLGDEDSSFTFGTVDSEHFYVFNIDRSKYKEKILTGTMTLKLTNGSDTISLTDDSLIQASTVFTDAGRKFQLISGSAGVLNTSKNALGYSSNSGSYGWFLPDVGLIILNGSALDDTPTNGGISLGTGRGFDVDNTNPEKIYDALNEGGQFTLNSQESLSSDFVFIRATNSEFNYSENPSFISGSTGAVIFDSFIDNPLTYITTVGLYNDNQELLAVAKLSRPLPKDFTKELLVRVKLDF